MTETNTRVYVGIVLALVVTLLLAGVVATSAAVSIELSDGDACETHGDGDRQVHSPSKRVTEIAGDVTRCLAEGGSAEAPGRSRQAGRP